MPSDAHILGRQSAERIDGQTAVLTQGDESVPPDGSGLGMRPGWPDRPQHNGIESKRLRVTDRVQIMYRCHHGGESLGALWELQQQRVAQVNANIRFSGEPKISRVTRIA
jgi:hypothetical protein